METAHTNSNKENYLIWGLKTIAGVLVFVILGVHFVVNHLIAPGGLLTYSDILAYYQNALVPIMEIAFLLFVVAHALLGLRSIIFDMHLSSKIQRFFDYGLLLIGTAAISYGIWIVIRVIQLGSK